MIGDRLVNDAWRSADGSMIVTGSITLEGARANLIKIEVHQHGLRGEQLLLWNPPSDGVQAALDIASQSDVVVFAAGLNAGLEGEVLGVKFRGVRVAFAPRWICRLPKKRCLRQSTHSKHLLTITKRYGIVSLLSDEWSDRW
jgi:hypothetical protein